MLTPEIWTMLYKITLSAGLGMVIGAERETRDKPAGLRTHALVAIGSTIFTILSFVNFFEGVGYSFDPSRIAAQVVVGIGFLGGGIIFMRGGEAQGITTAAGIWITAAIGMAVGFGLYVVAIYSALISVFILWAFRRVESKLHQK
ncbi:MAG TPA: MgtC/SapB family protein [Candidatus Paceibacterota bacterium]